MKTVSLSGSLREGVGKKDAVQLRKSGRVPAVIYGGEEQIHLHVDAIALQKITHSPDVFQIQLDIDGKEYRVIIQEEQYHPVTDRAVHVDFLQCFDDKEIVVGLPVRTTGTSPGVVGGGALRINFRKVRLRGLPTNLPEFLEVDISPMQIGDAVRIRDLQVEGCEALHPDSAVVVAVKTTRAAMSAAAAAEGEDGGGGEE